MAKRAQECTKKERQLRMKFEDLDLKRIKALVFDFDGVFTDNRVIVDENGKESVMCSRSDGIGLAKVKSLGYKILILSTEKNQVVARRAEKLNVECIHGSENKLIDLLKYCAANNLDLDQILFVGNDINDIEVMSKVHIAISVNDGYAEVKDVSNYVLETNGGYGAVRELCDRIHKLSIK